MKKRREEKRTGEDKGVSSCDATECPEHGSINGAVTFVIEPKNGERANK